MTELQNSENKPVDPGKSRGTQGQWVCGPLRRITWTGRRVGDFVVQMYWNEQEGSVLWVDFEVFGRVPCGHCGADAGEPCRTPRGRTFDGFHAMRGHERLTRRQDAAR